MNESLKAKTFSNVGYNSIAKILAVIFQAIGNIILTRILTAEDYGIVGFALIFLSFLTQFSDLGLNYALVHRSESDDRVLNVGFTVKFFLGLFIFLLSWMVAPLTAKLFDNPAVVDVVRLMSLSIVINSLMFIPNVILVKELNYKKISSYNTLVVILQSAVNIILALNGFKYLGLVYAYLCGVVFMVVIVNIMKPVNVKFMYDNAIAGQLVNYGGNIFISNLLIFIVFNIDNFFIGSVAGANQLGYYALAFNWGSMMCTLLSSTLLTVMFPTFLKMQKDNLRIKCGYLRVLQYASFIGILVNSILFFIADDFLFLVLGSSTDKWLPSLVAFRILCIYGILRMLLEPVSGMLMAIGKTEQLRKSNFILAAIELTCLYPVLTHFGIDGVAALVTLAYLSLFAVHYPYLKKEIKLTLAELYSSVMPSVVAVAPIIPIILIFNSVGYSTIAIMIIKTLACAGAYILMYGFLTKWNIFKEVYGLLQQAFHKQVETKSI